MISNLPIGAVARRVSRLDTYDRQEVAHVPGNAAYRRYHMVRLLHRIGVVLPRLLDGKDLSRESRGIEQRCWRELGCGKQPVFDGDMPDFLMVDGDGRAVHLSIPTDPAIVAARLAALEPSPLPAESCIDTNLDTLARLLNFTLFESQWLRWSYCIRRFGGAILPVIPLRDATHVCDVMALLCEMPADVIRDAVASRRLHAWGLLDGGDVDGAMPSVLSCWLLATDQFADWIEQPYASASDLLTALCEAQVSLMAPR